MKHYGDNDCGHGNDKNSNNETVMLKMVIFFKLDFKFWKSVKSNSSQVSSVCNVWSYKASIARCIESKNTVCPQFLEVSITEAQNTIKLSMLNFI
jgi:hypothetical protein